MRKKNFKKRSFTLMMIIIVIAWAIIAITNFVNNLSSTQKKLSNKDLSYFASCNAAQVRFTFKRYTNTIQSTALAIKKYDNPISKESLELLDDVAKNDIFIRLAVDTVDGLTYTSDGHIIDITKLGYGNKIASGKPFVIDVIDALIDDAPTVSIIVPIKNSDNSYTHAIRGTIATATLTDTFTQTFSTAGGYYHIIDGSGRYVSLGLSKNALLMDENYFDAIEKLNYDKGFSAKDMKIKFNHNKSGYSSYSYNGHSRYTYYAPIGINEWYVIMVIPKQIVEQATNENMLNAFSLMAQIIVILLILTFYIYITQKRIRNTALLNEKCFIVLARQTNKIIFEWNFDTNTITALSNFQDLFGREPVTKNSAIEALNAKAVHEDDKEQFANVFKTIWQGNSVNDVRFRIKDVNNIYHWCSLTGLIINDQKGKPYKAIGSLENINEQVVKEEILRKKAETDLLTGLYNKTTTEFLIQEIFTNPNTANSNHALFLIDIDNFKNINDRLGHLYGDIVLAGLADLLKPIFRADDVVGRIGGDEFFVLIKNCHTNELAIKKANEICQKFQKTYTEGTSSVSISASIGISFYPRHGSMLEDLYKAADIALYNSKASGKNSYCIFDSSDINGVTHTYQSARTEIDTAGGLQKNFNENRIEYIFKLLYDSENLSKAITNVLQLIAQHFNFSRVNVFELDDHGDTASCTFEWCTPNIHSLKDKQQNIPLSKLDFIIEQLKKGDGIFAGRTSDFPKKYFDVYRQLGVKSLISFALADNDDYIGSIAFEDYIESDVTLSNFEIDELRTICQILGTFIVKIKLQQREK